MSINVEKLIQLLWCQKASIFSQLHTWIEDRKLFVSISNCNCVTRWFSNDIIWWQDDFTTGWICDKKILWQKVYLNRYSVTQFFWDSSIPGLSDPLRRICSTISLVFWQDKSVKENIYKLNLEKLKLNCNFLSAFPAVRPALHLPSGGDRAGAPRHLQRRLLVTKLFQGGPMVKRTSTGTSRGRSYIT